MARIIIANRIYRINFNRTLLSNNTTITISIIGEISDSLAKLKVANIKIKTIEKTIYIRLFR